MTGTKPHSTAGAFWHRSRHGVPKDIFFVLGMCQYRTAYTGRAPVKAADGTTLQGTAAHTMNQATHTTHTAEEHATYACPSNKAWIACSLSCCAGYVLSKLSTGPLVQCHAMLVKTTMGGNSLATATACHHAAVAGKMWPATRY